MISIVAAVILPASMANAEIAILDQDGNQVDAVKRGGCRVGGSKNERNFFLLAKSVDGKFRLTAFISAPVFQGLHQKYTAYYGGEDPQIFLTRLADDEPFSNYKLKGTPADTLFAGGVNFRKDGRRVALALYGASNKSNTEGYSFAGVIDCRYATRK